MHQNQEGQEYRAATSFINEKIKKDKIDIEKMQEIMDSVEQTYNIGTDDAIFKWIDNLDLEEDEKELQMRIREIEAENFKLFTKNFHEVNKIEKSDLIVFNGPNGYGKTSAFDIIEFCLTGTIKRIEKYNEELAIKKTEAFENKILISDETKKAFVKILFDNDGQCVEIKYTYYRRKILRNEALQRKIILIIYSDVLIEKLYVMEKKYKIKKIFKRNRI